MIETLYLTATLVNNGCVDPNNALGQPDGTWTGNTDGEPWDCRWSLDDPSFPLTGTQEVQVTVRRSEAGGNDPLVITVELWEDGSLLTTLVSGADVTSTTGVTIGDTFDASIVTDHTALEVRVVDGGMGGMPAGRRNVQVDGATFTAEVDAPDPNDGAGSVAAVGSLTGVGFAPEVPPAEGSGHVTATATLAGAGQAVHAGSGGLVAVASIVGVGEATPAQPALAPTLLTPADEASHDGELFTWEFNTDNQSFGAAQAAFAFRRNLGDGDADLSYELQDIDNMTVRATVFIPGSNLVVAGTSDGSGDQRLQIRQRSGSSWSMYNEHPTITAGVWGVDASPDGSLLALSVGAIVLVLDTSDWSTEHSQNDFIVSEDVAFSPDGSMLAVVYSDSPYLQVFDTSTWTKITGVPGLPGVGFKVAFSPDGSMLAATHLGGDGLTVMDVGTWAVDTGGPSAPGNGRGVVFSPDGQYLAVGGTSAPRFKVWEVDGWVEVAGTPTFSYNNNDLDWSPDGRYIVAGWAVALLIVWDTSTWATVDPPFHPSGHQIGVAFHPSGDRIVSGGDAAGASIRLFVLTVFDFEWWNGTGWQDTEIFIESADEQLLLPSGAWDG